MGKTKVPSNVKKRNTVSTYLNDQQKEDLEKKALESNLTVAEYMRNILFN